MIPTHHNLCDDPNKPVHQQFQIFHSRNFMNNSRSSLNQHFHFLLLHQQFQISHSSYFSNNYRSSIPVTSSTIPDLPFLLLHQQFQIFHSINHHFTSFTNNQLLKMNSANVFLFRYISHNY